MPRKRTVQPQPLETIPFDGGIAEVYADEARPIGRGLHRQQAADDRVTQAMSYLADLYLSKKPEDATRLARCLRSSLHFQKQLELRGVTGGSRALWQVAKKARRLFIALRPHMKKTSR